MDTDMKQKRIMNCASTELYSTQQNKRHNHDQST
jgi:hypothetical protein